MSQENNVWSKAKTRILRRWPSNKGYILTPEPFTLRVVMTPNGCKCEKPLWHVLTIIHKFDILFISGRSVLSRGILPIFHMNYNSTEKEFANEVFQRPKHYNKEK